MSDQTGPFFHAWCPDNERFTAHLAAFSALLTPRWWSGPPTREEIVEAARARCADATWVDNDGCFQMLSEDHLRFRFQAWRDSSDNYDGECGGPLRLEPEHQFDMLDHEMPMARGGKRSVEIESAIFTLVTFENTIDVMRRLCIPDETSRVRTGACTWLLEGGSPLDGCITYNADANVARDLALAWLNGYDQTPTNRLAELDFNALRARIADATAHQAQVAQASMIEFVEKNSQTLPHWYDWGRDVSPPPVYEMTREQVLAVLETPPAKLLEALESVAVPDAEWRAVEPIARENIEAKKRGAPTEEVAVNTGRHVRFAEQHAPYRVRRLHNGGVMLATHPYRTLWPLWASALDLLGIRALNT